MVVTRVPLIMKDRVRLVNLTAKLRDLLVECGFEVVPDGYGHPSVKFNDSPKAAPEEKSLATVLGFLAKHGVAFANDYKQTYPPSYALSLFREQGLYKGKIITCGYDGHKWIYEEI